MGILVGKNIILTALCLALVGCDISLSADTAETRSVHDDANLTKDNGFYVHIKADFEVIKTGESLNFDYVISCYNREAPGSFHGILKPAIMFKATSTGEAIAIVPPRHYCERGLRGYELEQASDSMTIPQVTWYPDVEDLSFAITYMSDDAYKNPNAHIRFKSYEFVPTNKEHFLATKSQIESEYKQVGDLPGPFGCTYSNVQYRDDYSCGRVDRLKRREGQAIVYASLKYYGPHVRVYSIPDKLVAAIRRLPDGKGRYYCDQGKTEDDRKHIPSVMSFRASSKFNVEEKQVLNDFINRHHDPRNSNYLGWDSVENSESNIVSLFEPVEGIYPYVRHGLQNHFEFPDDITEQELTDNLYDYYVNYRANADKENLRFHTVQVLHDEAWRGFGIVHSRDIPYNMPELAVDFEEPTEGLGGAAFINGKLVCLGAYSAPRVVYDLEQKLVFKIGY